MEELLEINWTAVDPVRERYYLKAEDFENCVTEKILRNTFYDPLISSSDEEEQAVLNWDEIFNERQKNFKNYNLYVPGLKGVPKYPKLSCLTPTQHTQLLKVILVKNPHILPQKHFPKPGKADKRLFEQLKLEYENEQKEFQAWAKNLWTTTHCVRALRPKPPVELVYEAQFKMRANELQCYPKSFTLAAQIPLETNDECELTFCEDLISVNNKDLAQIQYESVEEKITIVKQCSTPEPCNKHPCKFILPTEDTVSILPLPEIQRELAQYTLEHGAQYIASESALKCLLSTDQAWNITVTVCEVINPNGEKSNVTVLGSEFAYKKEDVLRRTYKAFRHLLEDALVPISEKSRIMNSRINTNNKNNTNINNMDTGLFDLPSSDEEDNLCIDTGDDLEVNGTSSTNEENMAMDISDNNRTETKSTNKSDKNTGFYHCTCRDTMFERPPPRSYKKWRVNNKQTSQHYDVIVHCAHKTRNKSGEVILEPIPEYQLECGAVSLSPDRIAALALSLYLRKNASLLNVRVEGGTGEIVTMEAHSGSSLALKYGDAIPRVANMLHCALHQLQGLLPGNYVLRHEPSHGANAMLYSPKIGSDTLVLSFDLSSDEDPSACLKTAPTLCTDPLPMHKFYRTLPCAFTPYKNQLTKASRKPPTRIITPPQAIKWPSRRNKKKKHRN